MNAPNREPAFLIAESEKLADEFARKLLGDYLKEIQARLLELADNSRSNAQQWQLLEMSRQLKQKRHDVESSFLQELHHGFSLFQDGNLGSRSEPREDTSPNLSLLANDKLEVELAQSSFSRRAETRYTEDLFALNRRLSMLRGGRKIVEDSNPVGPVQLANCLQQSLSVLTAEIKVTILLYRVFEKMTLPLLGKLYGDINQLLIGADILPHLRYSVSRQNAPAAAQSVKPATAQTAVQPHVANRAATLPSTPQGTGQFAAAVAFPDSSLPSQQYQQALYGAIRLLQSGVHPSALRPQEVASADELVSVIQNVQSVVAISADRLDDEQILPCDTVHAPGVVRQRVQAEISRETGKNVAADNASLIDLVGMIFEYMLSESGLPDNVKAVLSYLHTPFLKIAFLDQQLFAQPDHPARQLLNALEETGSCWVNNDGTSQFKAFPKIKAVVRRVLTEFTNDMTLINDMLAEVREFNEKVAGNVNLLEQRAAQKAEGEDRLRQVKKQVNRSVRQRIEGKKLPSPLVVLLLHPWSEYLTFVLLRHGEDSQDWKSGLDVIDDILWSVQPKSTAEEKKRLVVMQEVLQATLQKGFDTIAYDQVKAGKLLESLQEMQLIALQNRAAQAAPTEMRQEIEATAVGHAEAADQPESPETPEERDLVEKLRMMEFGTWLDFDELDGQRNQRLKIAWFNARTSHYMLVNRAGKQAAIMSAVAIARHLLARNVRIISGTAKPFFERAMENIFSRLQAQAA